MPWLANDWLAIGLFESELTFAMFDAISLCSAAEAILWKIFMCQDTWHSMFSQEVTLTTCTLYSTHTTQPLDMRRLSLLHVHEFLYLLQAIMSALPNVTWTCWSYLRASSPVSRICWHLKWYLMSGFSIHNSKLTTSFSSSSSVYNNNTDIHVYMYLHVCIHKIIRIYMNILYINILCEGIMYVNIINV